MYVDNSIRVVLYVFDHFDGLFSCVVGIPGISTKFSALMGYICIYHSIGILRYDVFVSGSVKCHNLNYQILR